MRSLTKRQAKVLAVISRSIADRGYPPTLREIAAAMGIKGTNGISDHLMALERKGHLRRDPMRSRGIVLTSQRDDAHERALLAELARVAPVEAVRATLDHLATEASNAA